MATRMTSNWMLGPPWTNRALPADPLDRLDWQRRAASIGAWRELSGCSHPDDPIGPEPVAAAPDLRVAWYEALAALGPADGPDVRGIPDGRLLHLRDTYPVETAWAPQYVGDELRQVRAAALESRLAGLRVSAEAAAAKNGDPGTAARQQELAASYHALHQAYRQRETVFATVMADRADWEAATRAQRHLAVAADAELRRRTRAMHLLQAGVNLIYIRDLLGHADVSTTEIYARADAEAKRKAIESAYQSLTPQPLPDWTADQDLLAWLDRFCE